MKSIITRAARNSVLLAGMAFALPVSCSQPGDGSYSGGVQASPAGRINPFEPGFANTGTAPR